MLNTGRATYRALHLGSTDSCSA